MVASVAKKPWTVKVNELGHGAKGKFKIRILQCPKRKLENEF
jgi:hypothetical protein